MKNFLITLLFFAVPAWAGPRDEWNRYVTENAGYLASVMGHDVSQFCNSDFVKQKRRLPAHFTKHKQYARNDAELQKQIRAADQQIDEFTRYKKEYCPKRELLARRFEEMSNRQANPRQCSAFTQIADSSASMQRDIAALVAEVRNFGMQTMMKDGQNNSAHMNSINRSTAVPEDKRLDLHKERFNVWREGPRSEENFFQDAFHRLLQEQLFLAGPDASLSSIPADQALNPEVSPMLESRGGLLGKLKVREAQMRQVSRACGNMTTKPAQR